MYNEQRQCFQLKNKNEKNEIYNERKKALNVIFLMNISSYLSKSFKMIQ